MATGPRVFRGTAFFTPSRYTLRVLRDNLISVNAGGVIESVLAPSEPGYAELLKKAEGDGTLVQLGKGQFLLPGMLDLHVHAPQWPQAGKALDLSLYDWLQNRTFPLEAKYADSNFAKTVYSSLVATLLANGTTTAVYFSTIHNEASMILAQECLHRGQRAVIGRVAMDLADQCPDFYRDSSAEESVRLTEEFIEAVRVLPGNETGLVLPAVTPRFAPTCSTEAMTRLGAVAVREGCHVQTHCSESDWEHGHVFQRFGLSDARALESTGLLTGKTVLAHANFISEDDMDLIRGRGSVVAHCPVSNFYFSNAVFPLKQALDRGVHVGMGTDLSGGYSPFVFDTCRYAITAALALDEGVDPQLPPAQRGRKDSRINHIEAFWVATASAGAALGLPVGQLAKGFAFDCIVVDVNAPGTNVVLFDGYDTDEDVFQKIFYNVGPMNICQTWVGGQLVHQLHRPGDGDSGQR